LGERGPGLEREAGQHREHAIVRFRLACCHARLGDDDPAIRELRGAIESNPQMRQRAQAEEGLASPRHRDDWPGDSG